MKRKQLLTKVLLAVAMLGVGTNSAWADVTPVNQDYSGGVADWTSASTGRYTVDMNAGGYLTVNAVGNGNNGTTITGTTVKDMAAAGDDFASSDDFTMIFDLQLNGGNNQASSFLINDKANSTAMLSLAQTAANSTTWTINNASDKTVTLTKSTWYTFKLSKSGSMLYLTVTPTAGGDPVLAQQTIAILSAKGGLGNMIFNTKRYYSFMAIDNVVLRDLESGDVPVGTATSYTIKYRNESDVEIASDIVTDGMVDDVVTASAAQMNPIIYNEQKYIYKSGNDNITLVESAASNVITLVYREANTYTYKLTSSLGTVLANSSDFEGNSVYLPYPKYELNGNILYLAAGGNAGDYFRDKYTLSANVDETKAYTKTAIKNVVFYIEGENITGASVNNNERSADTRNSNGAVGYAAGTAGENDLVITKLPAGKYKIVANVHTSTSAGGSTTIKLGANTFVANGAASSYNVESTSDEYTITEATDLVLQAGGGKTNALDYIYVIRTDVEYATITSTGWATLYTPYALDFSGVAGLTAYTAVVADNKVTLTEVTDVPANTGVVLKGAAKTYTIPVIASSETAKGDLIGNASAATAYNAYADNTLYMLKKVGDKAQFVPVTSGSIAAGKAYLKIAAATARNLDVTFADEATGISAALMNKETMNNEVYNLKGQRVAQPTKGLYIVNGKKMVIK